MELNESALAQILFLDSVFAGFGLAIAAQLALEKNPDADKRRIAIDLMRSSLLCILSFLFGIVYLMTIPLLWQVFLKALVVNASFVFLIIGTVFLVRSIGELATIGFGLPPTWVVHFIVRWTVGILAGVAVAAALIFLATFAGYLSRDRCAVVFVAVATSEMWIKAWRGCTFGSHGRVAAPHGGGCVGGVASRRTHLSGTESEGERTR